ncbi:MAG: ABC transporter permease [Ignavibacteriales bacterium]|nr:ABC transporter permease [Ignavibacteriales bacterium]
MKSITARLRREWQIIINDSGLMLILFIAPLFYAALYGSFYVNKTEHDVPVAFIDNDHSASSRSFILKADAHLSILVISMNSLDEAMQAVVNEDAHAVVYIEKDFEKHLKQQEPSTVRLYLNNTKFFASNDLNRAVNDVALEMDGTIKQGLFAKAGYSGKAAEILADPIQLEFHNIYNQAETYGDFIIPGLMILILSQVLFISIGQNMGKERETGTLIHHHGSRHEAFGALTAKMILYAVVFTLYLILFVLFLIPALGVYPKGNFFQLVGFFILFIVTQSAFAMFVSTFFTTKLSGLIIVSFTTYPILFVSGYVFPHESMSWYMVWIGQLLPSTPFLKMASNLLFLQSDPSAYMAGTVQLLVLLLCYSAAVRFRLRFLLK